MIANYLQASRQKTKMFKEKYKCKQLDVYVYNL